MRAGMYLRVSSEDQNNAMQKQEVTAFCAARGWEAIVFEDSKVGTNTKRPELQRMLSACRTRKLDVIVCWKMDRLFRSLKDLINTLAEWDALGIKFVAVRDNVDLTTPVGRLTMQVLGSVAEFEAALIKERVRAGVQAAIKRGVKFGGHNKKRDDEKIRDLRGRGMSVRQIARELQVSPSSVMRGLSNSGG